MTLQMLISSVGQDAHALIAKMQPECDCILVNQKMPYGYEEFDYKGIRFAAFRWRKKV